MRNTLTTKQQAFVSHKLAGMPNAKSAIAAGYAPANADVNAAKLMSHPKIKAALRAGKRAPAAAAPAADEDVTPFGLRTDYKSALELFQDAYNNPHIPIGLRIDAAKSALPYESAKIGDQGKKANAKERAQEIAAAPSGSTVTPFRTMRAPGPR